MGTPVPWAPQFRGHLAEVVEVPGVKADGEETVGNMPHVAHLQRQDSGLRWSWKLRLQWLQLWPELYQLCLYWTNPIYRMYNPIYNQLYLINGHNCTTHWTFRTIQDWLNHLKSASEDPHHPICSTCWCENIVPQGWNGSSANLKVGMEPYWSYDIICKIKMQGAVANIIAYHISIRPSGVIEELDIVLICPNTVMAIY